MVNMGAVVSDLSQDLCLNKPYIDGGYENSSRVMGKAGWDMQPPLRAATHVEGPVNIPTAGPARCPAPPREVA